MRHLMLLLPLIWMSSFALAADHTAESLATVKENVKGKQAVLVDVREKSEWNKGHVDDAIFLPLSSLKDGIEKGELDRLPKDKVIYCYCLSGNRALTAGDLLQEQGFTIKVLKPGYDDLIDAGFPKAKE